MGNPEPRVKIALIEDNPADVYLLRLALDAHGVSYDLDVLADGQQAIDYVEKVERAELAPPALYLLDLNLPVYGGLEVLRRIRMSAGPFHCRTAILTTSDAPADREQAHILGVDLYVQKPMNIDDFIGLGAPLKDLCYSACASGDQ